MQTVFFLIAFIHKRLAVFVISFAKTDLNSFDMKIEFVPMVRTRSSLVHEHIEYSMHMFRFLLPIRSWHFI